MSHRSTVYNDRAREEFIDEFGEVFETAIDAIHGARGFEGASEKQVFGSSGFERNLNLGYFLDDLPMDALADKFKESLELYQHAGATSFASRLGHPLWVTAFYNLLRRDGQLPSRFAYSLEVHEQLLRPETALRMYGLVGAQWEQPNDGAGKWLWQHGVSSEGAWDSVQRACLGPDLKATSADAKTGESCPTLYEDQQAILRNALEDLNRLVGVHMVGSHGARLWIQMVEDAIENSAQLDKETVQEMRLGGAHGTMIGTVPEVMEKLREYNVYVPVNVTRALQDEPATVLDRYGEEALEFFAPVKTLLENGVKVVAESENFTPEPDWYFEVLNAYVNRFTKKEGGHSEESEPGDTDVWVPEEGIDRVRALKLMTRRSAEFAHAEEEVGSIEQGKLADFVVVENDVLEAPQDQLRNNKVIMVGLDGEIEHRTDEATEAISIKKRTEC